MKPLGSIFIYLASLQLDKLNWLQEFIVDPSSPTDQDSNENETTSVGVVKDMETGKEFSILEFENEMGVRMTSPIMREVDRRARERGEKSEVE